MTSKITMLSLAGIMLGTTNISFCAPKKVYLPGTMKLVEQPITKRDTTTGFLVLPGTPTPINIEPASTIDPSSKLPIATAMTKKIQMGMPYVLAVAITKDAKGNYDWHCYDPQSIRSMWQAHPIRNKTTNAYGFVEKHSGLPVIEVYYYTINKLDDPAFTFLCTGKEILENKYDQVKTGLDGFISLVNATDKKTSDQALAIIKKQN